MEWLGDVPEHWEVRRTKTVLRERSQKGFPCEPLLAATQAKGVVHKDHYENRTVLALKDLHLLKLVKIGDFVISLRSFQGGIEYAREQGIISPAYTVLYPTDPSVHAYLALLFKSKPYIDNLTLHVTGIRQGQNIDYAALNRSYLPLPPIPEQAAIVRYLDYADRRIRRYVVAKERLIGLLEEEKQAVINRAVTRGLDPNVPLKPSGVEWLGDVPAHWKILQFGRVIDLLTGFPFKSDRFSFDADDIRLLRGINVSLGRLRWKDVVRWPEANCSALDAYRLAVGDIVLGMDRPFIEGGVRVASVSENDVPALLLQRVARLRPRQELSSTFTLLSMTAKSFEDYLRPLFTGISVPHVSPEQIKSYQIALPTTREQTEIVDHVVSLSRSIQLKTNRARRQIDLIQEYRTRLIADVVTGKLDVRKAAAGLPDQTDNTEETEEACPLDHGKGSGL